MASTPNHAAQGALISLAALRLVLWLLDLFFPVANFVMVPLYGILATACLTLGAILGAAPDVLGWVGRIGKPWDWDLYDDAHGGAIARALRAIPQYGLHLFVDRFFHNPQTGSHWWPKLWWAELSLWAIVAAGFYFLVR